MPSANTYVQVSAGGRLRAYVEQVSQDASANMSLVRVTGIMYNDSNYRSYHLDKTINRYVAGTYNYNPANFSFDIGGNSSYTFIDISSNVRHNSDGTGRVSFAVGYGETGTATFGDYKQAVVNLTLDTIGKPPSVPGTPTFTNVTSTSVTVSWAASKNNGGRAITSYTLRRWNGGGPTGSFIDNKANNRSRTISGLTPGNIYTFAVFANNGQDSGFSTPVAVQILAPAYIRVDGEWKLAVPYIRTGGVWKVAVPYVRDAGKWKLTE